jgi:hypothetical protein
MSIKGLATGSTAGSRSWCHLHTDQGVKVTANGAWESATFLDARPQAIARQLLWLDDLNCPVLGIYNRNHDYGVSLLNRSARPCC